MFTLTTLAIIAGMIALIMCLWAATPQELRDAALSITRALPNGAAATTTTAVDLGHGANGLALANVEFLISAPALGATPLPNTKTMTYAVVHSDNADLSSPVVLYDAVLVQTGAGGVGDVAKTARFRVPSNCKRYIGVRATGSAAGDASGSSFTLEPLF